MPVLILHYHELWLKGCNRHFFIQNLKRSVRQALEGLPAGKTEHEDHRMLVRLDSDEMASRAVDRVKKLPGIAYLAVAEETEPRLESICETGARLMSEGQFRTFAVRAKRSQKTLPFRSREIETHLGQRIRDDAEDTGHEIKVDLNDPDVTCYVEVTLTRALVYSEKIPGVGGLPTGSTGKLLCLLSGGFDSAVAAYKVIKRGVRLTFVHFWSAPATPGEESPPVARELVRLLTEYQGRSKLYLVPFGDIQKQVVLLAPEAYRILLYRRLMLRIAERLAYREHAHGIVTGDSIAQVASQTLKNMKAVNAAATLPIYRPVVGDDKQEILDVARKIGTYVISSEPFTDCCPMYLPKSPEIHAGIMELDQAEAHLDIKRLVDQGVAAAQREVYELREGTVRLRKPKAHEPVLDQAGASAVR